MRGVAMRAGRGAMMRVDASERHEPALDAAVAKCDRPAVRDAARRGERLHRLAQARALFAQIEQDESASTWRRSSGARLRSTIPIAGVCMSLGAGAGHARRHTRSTTTPNAPPSVAGRCRASMRVSTVSASARRHPSAADAAPGDAHCRAGGGNRRCAVAVAGVGATRPARPGRRKERSERLDPRAAALAARRPTRFAGATLGGSPRRSCFHRCTGKMPTADGERKRKSEQFAGTG